MVLELGFVNNFRDTSLQGINSKQLFKETAVFFWAAIPQVASSGFGEHTVTVYEWTATSLTRAVCSRLRGLGEFFSFYEYCLSAITFCFFMLLSKGGYPSLIISKWII